MPKAEISIVGKFPSDNTGKNYSMPNGTKRQRNFVAQFIRHGGDAVRAAREIGYSERNSLCNAERLLRSTYVRNALSSFLGTNPASDRSFIQRQFWTIYQDNVRADDPRCKAIATKALENVSKMLGVDTPPRTGGAATFEDLIRLARVRAEKLEGAGGAGDPVPDGGVPPMGVSGDCVPPMGVPGADAEQAADACEDAESIAEAVPVEVTIRNTEPTH